MLEHVITSKFDELSNVLNHYMFIPDRCKFYFLSLLSHLPPHRRQYSRNTNSINAALNRVRQDFISELELRLISVITTTLINLKQMRTSNIVKLEQALVTLLVVKSHVSGNLSLN